MITKQILEEVKRRLIQTYNPLAIYIFGSYAEGTQNIASDLDLAIIIDKYAADRHAMLIDGYRALFGLKISKDLFLFSQEEFEKYSIDKTRLSFTIKHEGKRIYASNDFRKTSVKMQNLPS